MSSGDKMAPFLASEMAWVCHVIFFNYVYIYTNYSTVWYDNSLSFLEVNDSIKWRFLVSNREPTSNYDFPRNLTLP